MQPITATVNDFCKLSGLSRRTVYRLIASTSLQSIRVGTRRLVVISSYHDYVGRIMGSHENPPTSP